MKKLLYYMEWAWSTWLGSLHQKKYCPLWDKKLNYLLDRYENTATLDKYFVNLGGNRVWVANRFFSYGDIWHSSYIGNIYLYRRPSVKTMVRLAILQDYLIKQREELTKENYRKALEEIK